MFILEILENDCEDTKKCLITEEFGIGYCMAVCYKCKLLCCFQDWD